MNKQNFNKLMELHNTLCNSGIHNTKKERLTRVSLDALNALDSFMVEILETETEKQIVCHCGCNKQYEKNI